MPTIAASNNASARECSPSMCRAIARSSCARSVCASNLPSLSRNILHARSRRKLAFLKFSSSRWIRPSSAHSSATYGWSLPTLFSKKARPSAMRESSSMNRWLILLSYRVPMGLALTGVASGVDGSPA